MNTVIAYEITAKESSGATVYLCKDGDKRTKPEIRNSHAETLYYDIEEAETALYKAKRAFPSLAWSIDELED